MSVPPFSPTPLLKWIRFAGVWPRALNCLSIACKLQAEKVDNWSSSPWTIWGSLWSGLCRAISSNENACNSLIGQASWHLFQWERAHMSHWSGLLASLPMRSLTFTRSHWSGLVVRESRPMRHEDWHLYKSHLSIGPEGNNLMRSCGQTKQHADEEEKSRICQVKWTFHLREYTNWINEPDWTELVIYRPMRGPDRQSLLIRFIGVL